ncbi:MAG: DnaJ domain-containing protein [Chloroflexota bacterium]|nr:DnaJ domain-containing protein [Chloroflexota bacterium]MDE3101045.1 DnaJ domain-containing protein [Chloroflexota bacterium]
MPVEYKDYYKILGVAKSAKPEEIKKAYRRLARQYHPDLNKGTDAERRFKEINEAQEVLLDPEKRARYDQLGPDWERYARSGAPGGASGGGSQWIFTGTPGAGGQDFSQFSDFFRTVFGDVGGFGGTPGAGMGQARGRPNGRARAYAQQGEDLESEVDLTLPEAYRGTERSLEIRREDGSPRQLNVKIPAGVRDGQRIRLAGQGAPGARGGPAGDLYLRVRVHPHPFFRRDGDDVQVDLPVALHEAMLGAEVTVPTLKGRVSLKIPPETQNGRVIRLAGQGMPRSGGGHGDMYVSVKVVLPQKLSSEERDAIQKLAAKRADENVRSHLL